MIAPPFLKANDKVMVLATARVVKAEAVKRGMEILRAWGLQVETGQGLFDQDRMFAGSDQQRVQDLQKALDQDEIRAIFCARGGYGTTRILDQVHWEGFKKNPKWVCGFSDITALLLHLNKLGYVSVHSTMPQLFDSELAPQDLASLKALLFGDQHLVLQASNNSLNQQGSAKGRLIGGNLSLLVHTIGTASEIDTRDKILCLEEVDEYLYHLDRMMIQMKRAGKLQALAGVAVGHLTKMKEGELTFNTDAAGVINSHIDDEIPLAFGLPFGHEKPNLAIPMGQTGNLMVNTEGATLSF